MKIFIVMPVFNEEKKVIDVLKELSKTKYPIIIIDDGSTDNSFNKIKNLKLKKTILLQHKINLGKGAALKTGCEYAFSHSADAVIMMDSDGQHKVSDLNNFVKKLETNKCDVIFGSRNLNLGAPIDRFLGNKIASVIVNIMFGIYVSDLICGFRAFTQKAYKKIKWKSLGYGVETEMVVRTKKARLIHCEVPVETVYYDNYKGVSILDAFQVLGSLFYWKLTI
ncbi:MAG: glycosyltransferase family 2 protein [bacterium]|nr:glycosyltransferase family 2 protein [bacterium]